MASLASLLLEKQTRLIPYEWNFSRKGGSQYGGEVIVSRIKLSHIKS